jgi:hypothetical protein
MLQGTGIEVYPLDLQGPVDLAHLVYGDDFFYDLYDDPEFIDHLFKLVNACIIKTVSDCLEIIAPVEYVAHYNNLVIPSNAPLKISEDTSTLLSRNHILSFALPNTNFILEQFGGGYIHYCGKNPHLYEASVNMMPKVVGINFGNTDMHDMSTVYRDMVAKGLIYYGTLTADELSDALRESCSDGVCHLMPVISCKQEQQQALIELVADKISVR